MTLLLVLPIRGSLTVSTMNPSRAYFSQRRQLNHAATNPAFNLLYSATHQADFSERYRFFSPGQARRLFEQAMVAPLDADTVSDGGPVRLRHPRPDVYIIVLESFSAHLMPSMGGEPVALGLDSIARQGVLFTRFYASSFRTDRALPAIFSGLPAQPSTSILKYVDKIERLPSIPRLMKDQAGYQTAYYYGGDTNFTNMQAYLMSMGIDRVVSDHDFALGERASKWGAPDHLLFQKALADIVGRQPGSTSTPWLTMIQTSSSHEPFEVPYDNPRFAGNPQANAFAYTDSCLMAFVDGLKAAGKWDNALLLITPDHYGCWPQGLDTMPARHHIPLVLAGGALETTAPGRIATVGTQADIAATLAGLLGLDATQFRFSRDLLAAGGVASAAVFSEPGAVALVAPDGYVEIDPDANAVTTAGALAPDRAGHYADIARAWLQTLYEYIDSL